MNVLVLLSLFVLPGDVRIATLDGRTLSGELNSITADLVTFTESGMEKSVPVADVMNVEFSSAKPAVSAELQAVTLADGSQLFGTGIARTAKNLTIANAALGNLEFDNAVIRTIRLQPDNPAFRTQWTTFQQRASDKDLLIVAKRDGTGLDFLAGVVSAISSEKIDFLLDGDTVPVPAARVYGVVFAKPSDDHRSAATASVRLTTLQGDIVGAKSIRFDGSVLSVEATWGQTISAGSQQVATVDLSGGRVQYLSDLEPIEETFSGVDPQGSLFAGLISDEQQTILFGPRRDSSFQKESKLRLRGTEFQKGLCLHSKTEISWAIDKKYSSLDCLVGVDDEVAFNGRHAVAVRISGDDTVLFEKLIATTDQPIPLKLALDGVSTLAVSVDYGDGDSTCDWLDLADAKLIVTKSSEN